MFPPKRFDGISLLILRRFRCLHIFIEIRNTSLNFLLLLVLFFISLRRRVTVTVVREAGLGGRWGQEGDIERLRVEVLNGKRGGSIRNRFKLS